MARRCSFTKSHVLTVSQYISVKSESFMSNAMTFMSRLEHSSTRAHMAGDGISTVRPVSCSILWA